LKILKQEKTGNRVKLEIEEDRNFYKLMEGKAYEEVASDLTVPGFRKGKAPRNIVEQYINREFVVERATQNIVSSLYFDIIKSANIEPVDFPDVVITQNEEKKPFLFTLEVDVYPEVKLGKYKGLKAEKERDEVSEKEVDQFIDDLRARMSKVIEVSGRGVEDDDIVEIDVKAASKEGDIKNLSGRRIAVMIGKGQIAPAFDKELLGLTVGESKQFNVNVPIEHFDKQMAGKSVSFNVTPRRISKRELPPATDEFAKEVSGLGTVEALRQDLKMRLHEEKRQRIEGEVKNKLIEEVVKLMAVQVPGGMVRRETDLMIDELKSSLAKQQMTLENYVKLTGKGEDSIRKEMGSGALERAKAKIALRMVAAQEKLEVTPEEFEGEIQALASSSGEKPEKFKKLVGEDGQGYIREYLLRRKALDYIMSQAKVMQKK